MQSVLVKALNSVGASAADYLDPAKRHAFHVKHGRLAVRSLGADGRPPSWLAACACAGAASDALALRSPVRRAVSTAAALCQSC